MKMMTFFDYLLSLIFDGKSELEENSSLLADSFADP